MEHFKTPRLANLRGFDFTEQKINETSKKFHLIGQQIYVFTNLTQSFGAGQERSAAKARLVDIPGYVVLYFGGIYISSQLEY